MYILQDLQYFLKKNFGMSCVCTFGSVTEVILII
jgi:hypothetical protein